MKAKAKPSSQRKKGNLYFSQTFALTTTKHCAKHFLSQGKLPFAAYIVLSISYYRLYTNKVKHLQLVRYYMYRWKFPLKTCNHYRFVEFHENKTILL